MIDSKRKAWNQKQKELRSALEGGTEGEKAITLFLSQHGATHTSAVAGESGYSFADQLLAGLNDEDFRRINPKGGYSILWRFWHMARIEDITMSILVADRKQVFIAEGWRARLGAGAIDTGNAMDQDQVEQLNGEVDIRELLAYRDRIGVNTRDIVPQLSAVDFGKPVLRERLDRVLEEGAVVPEAMGLIDYWGGRTIAGLLLMPPTRHNMVHLNESFRLKPKGT